MSNIRNPIVAQTRHTKQSEKRSQQYRQLGLFDPQSTEVLSQIKSQKPQISSTPGTSPKELSRYRVTLAGQVLGDRLTADEAIQIAKWGGS